MEEWEGMLKLVRQLQAWRDHEEVQERGLVEISQLCVNQFLRELLREAGGIEVTVEALMRFPSSVKVQFAGLQAISHLASASDKCRARLMAAGAAQVLVQCLARFSSEQAFTLGTDAKRMEGIRALSLLSMAHLAQSEESIHSIVGSGAWDVILVALQRWQSEDEVQLQCCRLISCLADGLRPSERQVPQACQVVTSSLSRAVAKTSSTGIGAPLHPQAVKTLGMICCAVSSLAALAPENAAQMSALGACKYVERLMTLCQDELVQEWGSRALAEIASGDASSRASIRTFGGCKAVLTALSMHPSNPRVQFAGCYAIASIAGECAENQALFYELGAVRTVQRALEGFPSDHYVQEWGLRAFAELAADSSVMKTSAMEIQQSGGCGSILAALCNHPSKPRVQFAGCYAIATLAPSSRPLQRILGEAGACKHIESALSGWPKDANVQEWGCRALAELAFNDEDNQNLVRAAEGCIAVVKALARFPYNPRVQFAGCYAITQLASGNRENQICLAEAGACEKMLQALVDLTDIRKDSHVKSWAQRGIISLASNENLSRRLKDARAVAEMARLLKEQQPFLNVPQRDETVRAV